MKSREFREIQVSSTQLAVIFLGILVIGVVIFLLGVSVGKKHAQAAVKANVIAQKEPEQVKEKITTLPQTKPSEELKNEAPEKAAPTPVESTPVKKDIIPQTPDEKTKPAPQPRESPAQTKTAQTAPIKPAPPAKKGLYYVQVGALAEEQAARATAEKFRRLGYPVAVMAPQASDKSPVFRVRVGGFSTRELAEEARQKLASAAGRKTDYFIVRD